MNQYWSEKAKTLTPYTAGEQPQQKLIKLNTNENPYEQSPKVLEAIMDASKNLRLYPSPNADALREKIAQIHGVKPQQVFCANGSDEALAMCFLAFFAGNTQVEENWFPLKNEPFTVKTMDITYSFYPVWAKLFDVPLETVPLKEDYTVDIPKMCGGQGVIIANPNAPTGIALDIAQIEQIVSSTSGVCVIDEAYCAFGACSALPLVGRYQNIAVVHTLSKSHCLAGLRVGYVIADENLIHALETIKDSFNSYPVDMLAQAGAIAALSDVSYYEKITAEIIETRDFVMERFQDLDIRCLPSCANFIFAEFGKNTKFVFDALRKRGILVRYFAGTRTKNFLRITIGSQSDMKILIKNITEIVRSL
ncbi:MAG: aminotransferase class I/II-fold pyridoxal phosphate-dependent enzyme [Christensenellaceae bacterium]